MIQLTITDLKTIQEDIKSDLQGWYNAVEDKLSSIGGQQDKILEATANLNKSADTIQVAVKEIDSQVGKVNVATDKIASNPTTYRDVLLKGADGTYRESDETRVKIDVERKAKQIFIIIKDFDTSMKDPDTLAKKANGIIEKIKDTDRPEVVKVDFVTKFPNGGTLFLMNSKEAANWLREPSIEETFLKELAKDAYVKERTYNIILRGVLVTFNPGSEDQLREIEKSNGLLKYSILKAKWIKPEVRRCKGQTHAHTTAAIGSAATANGIIKEGLQICGALIRPEKLKQEPLQCMRCRLWGHFATNCMEQSDACGTCGEAHRTNQCKNPDRKHCVSCKTDTHTSWDRNCPEFIRRRRSFDDKHPENNIIYFPTEEDWTLTTRPNRILLDERFPQRFAVNSIPVTIKKPTGKGKKPTLTRQIASKNTQNKEQNTINHYFSRSQANGKGKEPAREEGELPDADEYEECFDNIEHNDVKRLIGSLSN